jgi:hypothetical protein
MGWECMVMRRCSVVALFSVMGTVMVCKAWMIGTKADGIMDVFASVLWDIYFT